MENHFIEGSAVTKAFFTNGGDRIGHLNALHCSLGKRPILDFPKDGIWNKSDTHK
jgi:hypothetical protein